jgi:hypothetical protein
LFVEMAIQGQEDRPLHMRHYNETVRALSEITDPGLFEHLAAAVLRSARPELYRNLTQPGINADGKPVKSPVDTISFVPGSNPPHMIAGHHTTCEREDLRKKWLHDPSTVVPRRGSKPTAPAGDVIKTAAIANDERVNTPDLRVTLALTTNQEPPEETTREAESTARKIGIELDIWSRSRIADHLDHHPDGQWLRRKYLGIEQERLSIELLRELSKRSIEENQLPAPEEARIERDIVGKLRSELPAPVGFLVGESGYGKSIAAYQLLQTHVQHGGCGLVLSHEILASSTTLDQAIDTVLRRLHSALEPSTGAKARSLGSSGMPLLIVVEDVSRSQQCAALIERLAKWATIDKADKEGRKPSWQVVCPIWPQLISALGDEARKRVGALGLQLGPYNQKEARDAVQRRASLEGRSLLPLEADEIAQALGCDPLLIALHELKETPSAAQVIAKFISQSTERLSVHGGTHTAYEYESTLRALAYEMLERRSVSPLWRDVLEWFRGSPDQLAILRELTKHGEVIRIVGSGEQSSIAFRHDRVKKSLLISAAADAVANGKMADHAFSDPFFADVVGAVLAHKTATISAVARAKSSNPLSLFFALQVFGEPRNEVDRAIIDAIHQWLADANSHTRAFQTLRHWALHVLAQTQSSHVVDIVKGFKDRSWDASLAKLRNGELSGGVNLCYRIEPRSNAPWRDTCIDHAKARYGESLTNDLRVLLCREDLSEGKLMGALRLAGHFRDSSLADAIQHCWQSDKDRMSRVDDYLWAFAQCAGERTEELLTPPCDAWATLPAKAEKESSISPRYAVGDSLSWAFWRSLPKASLDYFIRRAGKDETLRSNILFMLRGVDDPDAVEFIAREISRWLKEAEGTDRFWPFVRDTSEHWHRQQREGGRTMSATSRQRLRTLWENETGEKHLRIHSLRMWAATVQPDDLDLLVKIDLESVIGDGALRARLQRGDQSAIPRLIEKIRESEGGAYWWQVGREIWSDVLTNELDGEFSRRGATATQEWDRHGDGDWITAELLTRLDTSTAERLLLKHWDHLRSSSEFIQSALYVATPRLRKLVQQAMSQCPDRAKMLQHVQHHFGIRMTGHPGVTRVEQVEALLPYLDDLDDMAIHDLWELCSNRGWMALRKAHLDARLTERWRVRSGLDDKLMMQDLDKEMSYDRTPWMDRWVDDHLGSGLSMQDILRVARKWLQEKKTAKAMEVVSSIVTHAGRRADAEILLDGSNGSAFADEIVVDTRFAIFRRTLE